MKAVLWGVGQRGLGLGFLRRGVGGEFMNTTGKPSKCHQLQRACLISIISRDIVGSAEQGMVTGTFCVTIS